MKRYITMVALVFFAQCGLYTEFAFGAQVNIMPTSTGEDSIVSAIQKYSNLTKSDVDYNAVQLGSLGTFGAFMLGAASTIGAGVGAYQKAGIVQSITPERVPGWMTNALVLAGLGSAGVGYVSYKSLYPRIREGIVEKVQKFIEVCNAIHKGSPVDKVGTQYSIVSWHFNDLQLLRAYLPNSWQLRGDMAVYKALCNLAEQGEYAELLLNQIGSDDNSNNRLVVDYTLALKNNAALLGEVISEEDKKKLKAIEEDRKAKIKADRDVAKLADIQANVGLKQAGTSLANAKVIQTYGEILADSVRNAFSGFNYLYKNKEKIIYRATILSGAAYGGYVYLKNKLGYTG